LNNNICFLIGIQFLAMLEIWDQSVLSNFTIYVSTNAQNMAKTHLPKGIM
jgi:hypothetical protein